MGISLHNVSIENLRGFQDAELNLDSQKTLIVGVNNSGKTSILKMLDWIFNLVDIDAVKDVKNLTPEEQALFLPARNSKKRARRLVLGVRLDDQSDARKYGADEKGVCDLRFNVRISPSPILYLAIGKPARGESVKTNKLALSLLVRLREECQFKYISSLREAGNGSIGFGGSLRRNLEAVGVRGFNDNRKRLDKLIRNKSAPIWKEIKSRLPAGMAQNVDLSFDCDDADFLDFVQSKVKLKVSTGDHDHLTVAAEEVGSGLQSLIDLGFQLGPAPGSQEVKQYLAVEEPEAFLHPSAQRSIAEKLFSPQISANIIVTSHSSTIVAEANFRDLVICADHKFHHPLVSDDSRDEINTSLLSGHGAEAIFGRAVLLVEGQGDKLFFDRLRRRYSKLPGGNVLNSCFVIAVGGKDFFAPWIRFFDALGKDRPINWLIVADGDALKSVRSGYSKTNRSLPSELAKRLEKGKSVNRGEGAEFFESLRQEVNFINEMAKKLGAQMFFLECDLEESALSSASPDLIESVASAIGLDAEKSKKEEVLKRLGSLAYRGKNSDNEQKAPYLRNSIASRISYGEMSKNLEECLVQWFSLVMEPKEARKLIKALA